jgi:hypothetical protein
MLAPQMPQTKAAKPEEFVDISFLNEVEKDRIVTEMAQRYPSKRRANQPVSDEYFP